VGDAVGLIVNPVAGRDIRRLVGAASVMPNHEKSAIVRRVLAGLEAGGVTQVRFLDDGAGIVAAALQRRPTAMTVEPLPVELDGTAADSMEAARQLAAAGVGAIITLGGDGTNRAVASACGEIPMVAISSGTNNVVPSSVDGTVAGTAAASVTTGAVGVQEVAPRSKWVEVATASSSDVALVDVATCRDSFRGAAAIWEPDRLGTIVLSRAEPWAVGLSAIGGRIRPIGAAEPGGLHLEVGPGGEEVPVVLLPGVVRRIPVRECRRIELGEAVALDLEHGIVALDGERELPLHGGVTATVTRRGPRLVNIRRVLELTAGASPLGRRRKETCHG
jgi:predicted polyphosphate/ATP-dependent NAD kinase